MIAITKKQQSRKGNQGDHEFRRTVILESGVNESGDNLFADIFNKGSDDFFEPKRKPFPTHYPPGSQEKMVVMSMRLMAGEELHHENDGKVLANMDLQKEMANYVKQQYGGRKWKNGKATTT